MDSEFVILPSAHRHGVSEEGMLHALSYSVRHFAQDDDMTMVIGPDLDGTLIEIGIVEWHDIVAIAHAFRPARTKYLR